jgi:tRNA(Ile)-lysidine synthase
MPNGPVVVRSRLPGDAIRLPGGTKTLKKLFIDAKIPASQRPFVPIVADAQGVLGVLGFGADVSRAGAGFCFQFEQLAHDEK